MTVLGCSSVESFFDQCLRGNLSPVAGCGLFTFSHFWPLPFASRVMREATPITIRLPVLCEQIWVSA